MESLVADSDGCCLICQEEIVAGLDRVVDVDRELVHERCAEDEQALLLGSGLGAALGLIIGL
jgi:hypothetical protein